MRFVAISLSLSLSLYFSWTLQRGRGQALAPMWLTRHYLSPLGPGRGGQGRNAPPALERLGQLDGGCRPLSALAQRAGIEKCAVALRQY